MTTQHSTAPAPNALQSRALRDTLGQFATGVTVVTTCDTSGAPLGMTVNSFNSVSLDPALILWSIDRQSMGYEAFTKQPYFAVHVLKADQQHVSNLFAGRGADKFGQVRWQQGPEQVPMLEDCAAYFHCRLYNCVEGGDHTIILGEVLDFRADGGEPLVFHRGCYRSLSADD